MNKQVKESFNYLVKNNTFWNLVKPFAVLGNKY